MKKDSKNTYHAQKTCLRLSSLSYSTLIASTGLDAAALQLE